MIGVVLTYESIHASDVNAAADLRLALPGIVTI